MTAAAQPSPRAFNKSGLLSRVISSACARLYDDAFVAVTAHPGPAGQAAAARIEEFWRALGARPVRMDARVHDTRVAAISHLPHVAAALIVEAALRGADPGRDAMIAGGFRDTTRVASGPAVARA